MARCAICNKGPKFGNHVSHSNHRTKRQWKPNLHKTTIIEEGQKRTMTVCSRCMRTMVKT